MMTMTTAVVLMYKAPIYTEYCIMYRHFDTKDNFFVLLELRHQKYGQVAVTNNFNQRLETIQNNQTTSVEKGYGRLR